jgi:ribosome-associated protein
LATLAKPRTQKGKAVLVGRLAQTKLGHDILLLDLTELESAPADFFVIVTVDSESQARAVTDAVAQGCKAVGFGSPRMDAKGSAHWVVMDFFDIVVHIMHTDARDFYKLERLWGDAKAYTLTNSGTAKAVSIKSGKVIA